jgi:hypothetical protein
MDRQKDQKRWPGDDGATRPTHPPKRQKDKATDDESADIAGGTATALAVIDTRRKPEFSALPNELLAKVLEHLAPEALAVRVGASLWDMSSPAWLTYRAGRSDLLSLRCVSHHLSALVEPLLLRHIVVQGPWSMCLLLYQLFRKPSLGPLIRHIAFTVELEACDVAVKCFAAWISLRGRYLSPENVDSALDREDIRARLLEWLEGDAASRHQDSDPMFPTRSLCAIVCLANRTEVLNLRLQEPTNGQFPSRAWTWFLNEQIPRREDNVDFPHQIMPLYPSWEYLQRNPCWPPPFLRKWLLSTDHTAAEISSHAI